MQEVVAAAENGGHGIAMKCWQGAIAGKNLCIPQNRIHRCADLMAHAGEKL